MPRNAPPPPRAPLRTSASPTPQSRFADFVCELLASVGPVSARRMFGGYGLYAEGVMLGLIAQDRVFLKTDAQTRERFVAAGCAPFVYESRRGVTATSYYEPPADALESPALMQAWARLAIEAALRSANAKAPARRAAKPPAGGSTRHAAAGKKPPRA
ncbi:MAG: TfoX/Sxy family protein [Betaproteobacteria bacterium]|nr:TfoX/Sxy family protein [Betaproteobacteria bacterium]